MLIHHLALASDWSAAQRSGDYRVSTRGTTLEQEGFVHCSHPHQWEDVRAAFYADVTEPLVLLTVDTDRLTSPVIEEGGFPHVYGPLDLAAVIDVRPIDDGQ
jgi:uncharacterized protein (DUF952 family)